jgi:3-phosphoshikimate 1-carboxyvinyltransferase
MAAAVAASACAGPSRVTCAESARKSYPGFFQDYYALGGNAHVVDAWE